MKKINVFFFNTIDLKPLLSENMALTFSLVVFTFSCIRVSTLKFSKQKFQKKKKITSVYTLVQLFATLWTVARQEPLSMGFSRQEYWSGLPCPPPGDLPPQGSNPPSLMSTCTVKHVLHHQYHLGSPVAEKSKVSLFFLLLVSHRQVDKWQSRNLVCRSPTPTLSQ